VAGGMDPNGTIFVQDDVRIEECLDGKVTFKSSIKEGFLLINPTNIGEPTTGRVMLWENATKLITNKLEETVSVPKSLFREKPSVWVGYGLAVEIKFIPNRILTKDEQKKFVWHQQWGQGLYFGGEGPAVDKKEREPKFKWDARKEDIKKGNTRYPFQRWKNNELVLTDLPSVHYAMDVIVEETPSSWKITWDKANNPIKDVVGGTTDGKGDIAWHSKHPQSFMYETKQFRTFLRKGEVEIGHWRDWGYNLERRVKDGKFAPTVQERGGLKWQPKK